MEAQILELEKKYWKGMEDHEYETVKSLTRFPCVMASKNGVQSVDEPAFKKMFDSGSGSQIKVLNISDVQTQLINNTAIIAYLIELEMKGSDTNAAMKCACSSTWINENGNWTCAHHTESEVAEK